MNNDFNNLVSNFYFDCFIVGLKINKKMLSFTKEIINDDLAELRKSLFKIFYNINGSKKPFNLIK